MDRILSPKEFVIAGLLNEGPSHGYEIEKRSKAEGCATGRRLVSPRFITFLAN